MPRPKSRGCVEATLGPGRRQALGEEAGWVQAGGGPGGEREAAPGSPPRERDAAEGGPLLRTDTVDGRSLLKPRRQGRSWPVGRGTSVWTPVPGRAAWQGGTGPLAAGFAQHPGEPGHDLSRPSPGVRAPRGPSFRTLGAAVPAPPGSQGFRRLNGGRAHGACRASWSLTPRLSLTFPPRGCWGVGELEEGSLQKA